jgi:hypothetical protein
MLGLMGRRHPESKPRSQWPKYAGLAVLALVTAVVVYMALTR